MAEKVHTVVSYDGELLGATPRLYWRLKCLLQKEETDIFFKIVKFEGPDRGTHPSSTSSSWSPWSSEQATSPFNCADDWVPGKHHSVLLEMEEGVCFGPKNATPSQVVIKVRTGAGKRSFFESLERDLLLRVGMESNPGPVTIGETLEWYRNSCQNGKLAESEIKVESVKFFKLSGDDLNRDTTPTTTPTIFSSFGWLELLVRDSPVAIL